MRWADMRNGNSLALHTNGKHSKNVFTRINVCLFLAALAQHSFGRDSYDNDKRIKSIFSHSIELAADRVPSASSINTHTLAMPKT